MLKSKDGDEEHQKRIESRMPKRIKKRRKVQTDDGVRWNYLDRLQSVIGNQLVVKWCEVHIPLYIII